MCLTTVKSSCAIVLYLSWKITFVKSGGGFFPLHRFESAHTAFLIIVRRFCLANSLQEKFQSYVFEDKGSNLSIFRENYLLHQGRKYVAVYDKVSAFCAISCNVPQGPHCLMEQSQIKNFKHFLLRQVIN